MRGFGASGRSSSRIKDQARPALSALCSSIRSWSIVNRTSAPPTSPCWIVKSFLLGIAMRVQPREEPNHLGAGASAITGGGSARPHWPLLSHTRVKARLAVGTDPMAELHRGATFDVCLHTQPASSLVSDLLASGTDRQEARQRMYLRDGRFELLHKALAFEFAAPPFRDVLIDNDCPDDIPGGVS